MCPPVVGQIDQPATNFSGCWGCIDNAYNALLGSTFDGTRQATIVAAPCFINCTNQSRLNLYSFHPGACGVVVCDGSARMLSETIGLVPFCRLITYQGHEPVTDGSF